MDQYQGARPFVDVLAEEHPVMGVIFAEGKEPEKYFEDLPPVRVSGLRAILVSLFGF